MHDETRTTIEQWMAGLATALPPAELLEDRFRRLEIAELFEEAGEQGRDHWAGHVLGEVSLDYVTDEPFDDTDDEKARAAQLWSDWPGAATRW